MLVLVVLASRFVVASTKVGAVSLNQESSMLISTTRMLCGRAARALAHVPGGAHTVTGSNLAMAVATAAKALRAGPQSVPGHVPGRCGQPIQH